MFLNLITMRAFYGVAKSIKTSYFEDNYNEDYLYENDDALNDDCDKNFHVIAFIINNKKFYIKSKT